MSVTCNISVAADSPFLNQSSASFQTQLTLCSRARMFIQVSCSLQSVNSTSAHVNCCNLLAGGVSKADMMADTDLTADNICFPHEDIFTWLN